MSTISTHLKVQDLVLNSNTSKNATKLNGSFTSSKLCSEGSHSAYFRVSSTLVMDNAQAKVFARKKGVGVGWGVLFIFFLFGNMKIIFHTVLRRNTKASNLLVNKMLLTYNLSYNFCICLAPVDLKVLSSAQF